MTLLNMRSPAILKPRNFCKDPIVAHGSTRHSTDSDALKFIIVFAIKAYALNKNLFEFLLANLKISLYFSTRLTHRLLPLYPKSLRAFNTII